MSNETEVVEAEIDEDFEFVLPENGVMVSLELTGETVGDDMEGVRIQYKDTLSSTGNLSILSVFMMGAVWLMQNNPEVLVEAFTAAQQDSCEGNA